MCLLLNCGFMTDQCNTFANFFIESVIPAGYRAPTPKATFQLNDVVIARSEGKTLEDSKETFSARNPQKYLKYFNQVGTVIGYKPGTMSAKFAVEFQDGFVASFNTAHIIGPFGSKRDAEKATKVETSLIPPQLFAKYVPRENQIPTIESIEDQFKNRLVSTNQFVWLKDPVIAPSTAPGRPLDLAILAYKEDLNGFNTNDSGLYGLEYFNLPVSFKKRFLFFKVFNRLTGKFAVPNLSNRSSLFDSTNGSTGYFITFPEFSKSYVTSSNVQEAIKSNNFSELVTHAIEGLNKKTELAFKYIFNEFQKIHKLETIKTGDDYFDLVYGSFTENNLKVVTANTVNFDFDRLLSKNFDITQYKVEGNCEINLNKKSATVKAPAFVSGDLVIKGQSQRIANLAGLPNKINGSLGIYSINLDSLENCPEKINGDLNLVLTNKLQNLNFLPKSIKGNLLITNNVESFAGGENTEVAKQFSIATVSHGITPKNLHGIPKATEYNIGIPKEKITNYFAVKELENEFPEIQGTFA